jgi:hypothetical protein
MARSSAARAAGLGCSPSSTLTSVWVNRARRVSASCSVPRSRGLSRTPAAPSARWAPPTAAASRRYSVFGVDDGDLDALVEPAQRLQRGQVASRAICGGSKPRDNPRQDYL